MAAVTITTSTFKTSSPFFGLFFKRYMDKLNVTCGYPGLSFINTAKRAMDLLNIGIYGLAPKSNIQVGNEFLMDEVIGKASSIKLVRESVKEYDTELPLDISILERCLGCNVYLSASNITYDPAFITEYRDEEE